MVRGWRKIQQPQLHSTQVVRGRRRHWHVFLIFRAFEDITFICASFTL